MANRKGTKDAKENDFFRIGTDDSEKIPTLRASSAYCRATRTQVSAVPPSAMCRGVARRAKPETDRLFSFADLCIGKRKLSVLGALSEAPCSGMRARAVRAFPLAIWRLAQKAFQL